MKVKDLIKKLENFDQELDVFVPSNLGDHEYGYANSADPKSLVIEESDESESERVVIVIDEV